MSIKKSRILLAGMLISAAVLGCGSRSGSEEEDGRDPAETAIYAMQYCGQDPLVEKEAEPDDESASECINWLIDHASVDENGCYVWQETYDRSSDVGGGNQRISSYTQAVVCEAFLAYYSVAHDEKYMDYARKAAEIFTVSTDSSGLLAEENGDTWFPMTKDDKTYELIGDIRALIALSKLCDTADADTDRYRELYDRASETLLQRLPFYDIDYCIKDDLRIKQEPILFRFFNEYGDEQNTDMIERVVLRDPVTGEETQAEDINSEGEFRCSLPSVIDDCFRTEWLEMVVTYEDKAEQHMTLQKESLAGKQDYISVKDGDLLLTGNGETREWIIPIRVEDLGYEVSGERMEQYEKLFMYLAGKDDRFTPVSDRCAAYCNLNTGDTEYRIVKQDMKALPPQTPPLNLFSFDENGVVRQHMADPDNTKFDQSGEWDRVSKGGEPAYSLVSISMQAKTGGEYWEKYDVDIDSIAEDQDYWDSYDFLTPDNIQRIQSAPAYTWIEENADIKGDIATWSYDMYNCYNDLEQEPGWHSAYGQSLMLDALLEYPSEYADLIRKGCYAFEAEAEEGGLASYNFDQDIWFEEVPNQSHIFNADILSINTLQEANLQLDDDRIANLIDEGVKSLKDNLWRYDTGYWSKYDMNPQKEILFQIDWIAGEESPLIDEIMLCDPVTGCATSVDVGEAGDVESHPYISGMEWGEMQTVDGRSVRQFSDGYDKGYEISSGSTEQNSYFYCVLPDLKQEDYFDLMPYKLIIKYKDVAEGTFEIKKKSICEGNYLKFEQIPNAKIECTGDNAWKEAEIMIRPQDLGWFMGPFYQEYHVEQLQELAEETDDWFFRQYAEKWNYYLDKQEQESGEE